MSESDTSFAAERLRLLHGPPASIPTPLTTRVHAHGGEAAHQVAGRAVEIMLIVNQHSTGEWPSSAQWTDLLPGWFTGACSPPITDAQAADFLARWRAAPRGEQLRMEAELGWSLDDWLFSTRERRWTWWAHSVRGEAVEVDVAIDGWPTALGSLVWLLRACGATAVETE